MKKKYTTPKYIKIALDIAYRIHNGDLKEGSKVSGRSTLASKYNVSPETIRRSIALLKDMNVVEVTEKSGILIVSKKQAYQFIQNFNTKDNVSKLVNKTRKLIIQKKELEEHIEENITSIIEYSSQLRNIGLMYPFELKIPKNSHIIGKTIGNTSFWQNTKATILGIKRNDKLIISPGPYLDFREDDIILFVGTNEVLQNVENFINL
ncbi:TrkA C-terminal domain-containing protein [Paramaledivibacter caminithermalis]|uniref:Transcriptional regulator, GntR family n=1 Tax=Paramaledivibacter caminithermalis (strain DSM 15212 / CIP 107654 / DViRD3) TaxID=1121301 RepID=A0A1M6MRB7_PARC5|nr:TrkA C-terminal domain-containing protein [Paramaledivibacter caminithermalis]SHJ86058.1 transcriptional regulator, GntR family [Paramaledivibacter caminithermalis DSM 15212]